MDPFTALILELAKTLEIPPVTAALIIPVFIMVMNRIARLIPDTADGPLKWIRIAAVIFSAHVKDNSGVPSVLDNTGKVIRRTEIADSPEPIQGAAVLDPDQTHMFAAWGGNNTKED